MDQEDRQVWHRVVARRRQECASLDKLVALQFLSSLPEDAPEGSPSDQLEFALKSAYDIASDPNVKVKERRLAFEAIQRLRKSLNESLAQQQKLISARAKTTTATAVTTAKAPTTTPTTTATTTTNKSQDQTRLPAVPQVTPPGSVPPASTLRVSDTSASTNSSEPSRPQVSQNTAVTSTGSPPLHTTTAPLGNTGPGQVTANTSRSPDPPGTTAKATTNTAAASASDSQRSKHTSKSSTNTGNKDSTTQPTTSASRSQPTASTNPSTTSSAGARNLSLPIQNGTTGIDSVSKSSHNVSQPAPASRSSTSNQSTRPSTTSTGNASSSSHGTQAATATSPVPTKSTTATGNTTDKSISSVPQTAAGAGDVATSRKSSTQNGTATFTPTIPQTTTATATWGVPTKSSPTSTGVGGKAKSPLSLFQSLTTARTTSQSTQASATATATGNAATNNKNATTTLQTSTAGTGTATVTIARAAPAAPQTSTRPETWSKTQHTSTTATGNSGKTSSSAPQNAMGIPGWTIPTKTSTTATTTAPVIHQTATGSGNSNQPTSTATSGVGNVGRTTSSAPQNVATTTGSWVLPSQTTTTNAGNTGKNSTSTSNAPSSTTERAPQQTGIDTGATAANRHAGVSQTTAPALANKNRSITADLVAAATTTSQVAADAVSDVQPAPASRTKPSQQTTAGVAPNTTVAPPAYQQRSDAVVAIEKAKRAEKNGRSSQSTANASTSIIDSTSGVPPSIMSPFDPPMSLKKRSWHDTTNSNGMENGANKDRNKPTTHSSSSQEPPQKNPRVQEQPVAAMEPTTQIAKSQIVIDFPPDTKPGGDAGSRFSYSQSDRPAVRVYFHRHWPSYEMLRGAGRLFEIWEPYWQVEKVIASGVTSPVEKLEWKAKAPTRKDVGNVPRTVALFDVPSLAPTDVSKISWGMLKAQATSKPKDGDCTLLLRMLPIKRKPDENKKRANTHIWPIGTFLMINNTPVTIAQRKQASHDLSKWEYLSHPLELSYHIKNPKEQISISMCCQDATQYFYMVSVCSYKSPLTLKDRLLEPNNSFLHSLSMTESAKKAMEYINKNSMISIDDDDTGPNDETGLLIFSLVDPVTKVLMKTPVRGQKCKHWQCFDLQSFMEVNAPVSGGRWRCVCCEQFVNYQDLEVCGLTKEALVRFADVASATRDRVEFRADQTMTLLPAPKARYNNKRRQPPGSSASSAKPPVKNQQSIPDPIEIIDLD